MGTAIGDEEAVRHMERGIALYDRKLHASQAFLYAGHDPGACRIKFGDEPVRVPFSSRTAAYFD
jgi:hypothetical protein